MMERSSANSPCRWAVFSLVVALAALAPATAWSDVLRLKNGKVYEGKLVSRGATTLVFRVEKTGMSYTMEVKLTDVESLDEGGQAPQPQPAPAPPPKAPAVPEIVKREGRGEPYYVLPLRGVVGLEISDRIVGECLQAAQRVGAKTVILEIESPGGAVSELKALLSTLDQFRNMRLVAYVKEAKSAAAVLAMSCREIIMDKRSQIGAAVPYQLGPEGTPQNIAAKFESALRADFRSAAERGSHSPLLMDGMMRDDIELSLKALGGGRFKVVEGPGDRPLKKHGEILTLTAQQAIECGLALGSVERIGQCSDLLEIDEWHDVTDHGRERTQAWVTEVHAAMEQFKKAMHNVTGALTEAQNAGKLGRRQNTTDALRRAESNLRAMEELIKKYPGLGDDDTIREFREHIRGVRKALEP